MRVVGIGQCSLDYLFIIDSYPEPDTKNEVIEWSIQGGGPVATALVALSRLGVSCRFFGVIGDDEAGKRISDSLLKENIDISGLVVRKNTFSQVAFIAVERTSGRRTIFWKRPSGVPLRPEELPADFLDHTDFLLLDGLMHDVSIYGARMAKEKEIPVMLDAGKVREGTKELLGLCDYVVASGEFGRQLLGATDKFNPERALLEMKRHGAKVCTITLGSKGSLTLINNEIFHMPAFEVEVVDTTGAGDVFHGGYIYGLLQGWDIKEVVRFASAMAAMKCRKLGGREGIPDLSEVMKFLEDGV